MIGWRRSGKIDLFLSSQCVWKEAGGGGRKGGRERKVNQLPRANLIGGKSLNKGERLIAAWRRRYGPAVNSVKTLRLAITIESFTRVCNHLAELTGNSLTPDFLARLISAGMPRRWSPRRPLTDGGGGGGGGGGGDDGSAIYGPRFQLIGPQRFFSFFFFFSPFFFWFFLFIRFCFTLVVHSDFVVDGVSAPLPSRDLGSLMKRTRRHHPIVDFFPGWAVIWLNSYGLGRENCSAPQSWFPIRLKKEKWIQLYFVTMKRPAGVVSAISRLTLKFLRLHFVFSVRFLFHFPLPRSFLNILIRFIKIFLQI